MSIPPQLIRVKRKRDDESPVTFLQLDDEVTKRHRSGSNWVYQRRDPAVPSTVTAGPAVLRHDSRPVIHVSEPDDVSSPSRKRNGAQSSAPAGVLHSSVSAENSSPAKRRTSDAQQLEPRKFHVSRAMLSQATSNQGLDSAISKQVRYGPTLFVERSRKKILPKTSRQNLLAKQAQTSVADTAPEAADGHDEPAEQQRLKKPGVANKRRDPSQDGSMRNPLPPSLMNRHNEDMDKIAADMNAWALNEIGASLHSMEEEKKKSERPRFRPKAPEKRYQERHPQPAVPSPQAQEAADTHMADVSEEEGDDDDWIIEEYVRIPAHTMGLDVLPSDVGILVLDGEAENMLFYGPPQDEDDEAAEDDEDENAENHYTADYPEDEVDSDDEFDRHAYMFRKGNASDDEEFDDEDYHSDSDQMVLEGGDDDDDDARMDRIREFMRRNAALR